MPSLDILLNDWKVEHIIIIFAVYGFLSLFGLVLRVLKQIGVYILPVATIGLVFSVILGATNTDLLDRLTSIFELHPVVLGISSKVSSLLHMDTN